MIQMNNIDALISHSIYNKHDPVDVLYYKEQKKLYDNYQKTINFFEYKLWPSIEKELKYTTNDIVYYNVNMSLFKYVPFITVVRSVGIRWRIEIRYEPHSYNRTLTIDMAAKEAKLFIDMFDKLKEAIINIDSIKNEIETMKYQVELGNYYNGYNGNKIDYTEIDKLI